MKQRTLNRTVRFEGKGLHTGVWSSMSVCPAPENSGITFVRTDLSPAAGIPALASNITSTARSTTIGYGGVSVSTVEHIMSALTGLGIDNARVEINNAEVPILDGSARPYIEAIGPEDIVEQSAERKLLTLPREVDIFDEKTGSRVTVTPSDKPGIELTVDFGSRVLGVQSAFWDYSEQAFREGIAPCRTFVFFHEIAYLAKQGLVKGGDVDNAIVIVEHPATEDQIESICRLLDKPKLAVNDNGYLNNLELRFPNECGRHKLLDLIGDMRLAGGFLAARITAFKPGHTINSMVTKEIINLI